MGTGFGIVSGVLEGPSGRLGPAVVGRRYEVVFRYDGQSVWVWVNGRLATTEDAGRHVFMNQDFHHMRWINAPMTLHKLEFYELVGR